jgi:hypothetical protein
MRIHMPVYHSPFDLSNFRANLARIVLWFCKLFVNFPLSESMKQSGLIIHQIDKSPAFARVRQI